MTKAASLVTTFVDRGQTANTEVGAATIGTTVAGTAQ